jgi:CSLREA domain-containing protein
MRPLFRNMALVSLLLALLPLASVHAEAHIFVTTTEDELNPDGECSLREAIQAANTDTAVDACGAGSEADIIDLPAGTYVLGIPGADEDGNATGDLDISSDMYIDGYGAATIDGAALDRVFHITSGTVSISGLTIQNGFVGAGQFGAGILNRGALTMRDSVLRGNVAVGVAFGGGIFNDEGATANLTGLTISGNTGDGGGGGIYNVGTLTLLASTVSGNTSPFGVGIRNEGALTIDDSTLNNNIGGSAGGGILNGRGSFSLDDGVATLTNVTISGNGATFGGGINNVGTMEIASSEVTGNSGVYGGGVLNGGPMTVASSTISGNSASYGGGVQNQGSLSLSNSTISGNEAASIGGGIQNSVYGGSMTLSNTSVSRNSAPNGGGIWTDGITSLKNTLLANNTGDCSGTLTSEGYNLIRDTNGCTILGDPTGNITGADPLLGLLADNGGPTQTHALLPGSPAIDAGSPNCPPPDTDQRGEPRPLDGNGDGQAACDIGAYEAEETTPPPQPALPVGWHEGPFGEAWASGCSAYGWTYDPDNVTREVQVRVLVDDMSEPVAMAPASLLGRSRECPDDTCVFSVPLWGLIAANVPHQITAQALDVETGAWVDLSGTSGTLTCFGWPEGSHDGSEGVVTETSQCNANGWAVDPERRDQDVQVRVLSDEGEIVAEGPAGDYREDMESLGICEGGTCGFSFGLFDQLTNGVQHMIQAQAYDLETDSWIWLDGTPRPLTCLAEVSPAAHFTVFLEDDAVQAWGWPLNGVVEMTIDDPSTAEANPDFGQSAIVGPAPWDESQILAYFGFSGAYDVKPGDLVTLIYGPTGASVSYVVEGISLTGVDSTMDTITGRATPGKTVYVWPHGQDWAMQTPTAGPEGDWLAEFGAVGFDLAGRSGRAEVRDEVGNSTAVDWSVPVPPNPVFSAFPEDDAVEARFWPPGSLVHLSIDSQGLGGDPEWEQTATIPEGDPYGVWVRMDFAGSYDLVAGDVVTVTDGITPRTHTVRNLSIAEVDNVADTVSGTSDPYAVVNVWPHETGQQVQVTADQYGDWHASVAPYDIRPGSAGRSEIRDEIGNGTAVDWYVPNPHFTVFPEWDAFELWEWPIGASVQLSIEDPGTPESPDFEDEYVVLPADWNPEESFLWIDIAGTYNVKAGDIVTITGAGYAVPHMVRYLTVGSVDAEANTVEGTAVPGEIVHVWPHDFGGWQAGMSVETDQSGNWTADLAGLQYDLLPGGSGRAEIVDDIGNTTGIDWAVPRMAVYLEAESVIGWDWPHGADVHLTIDDPATEMVVDFEQDSQVEPAPWNPNVWWAMFDFAGQYDVKPGDIVVLTDGTTTLVHEVLPLTVGETDGEADTVAGTSYAGADVYVHPWDAWFEPVAADESGAWLMDFTDLYDIMPGIWGIAEVFDDANNSTAIDWMVPLRIDIRPWSGSNLVLCRATWDLLPVAVFSESGFDATAVDHDSVRFGRTGTEAEVVTVHGRPVRYARDVNGDGLLDMVYTFRFGDTGFSCADIPLRQHSAREEATLTGWMGEIYLEGRDSLTLVRLLGH